MILAVFILKTFYYPLFPPEDWKQRNLHKNLGKVPKLECLGFIAS